MERARIAAHGEVYQEVVYRVLARDDGKDAATPLDAADIAALLTSDRPEPITLLIEDTGGRGKSALVRELIRRAIIAFRNGSGPIPVLLPSQSESIAEGVQIALGPYAPNRGYAKIMLASRDAVLFVDGLGESKLTPSRVAEFLRSEAGRSTSVVIALRPAPGARETIVEVRQHVVLAPRSLDDITVLPFVRAYAPELGKQAATAALEVCRSPDGTYLPLLVRLRLLAPHAEFQSPSDVFAAAIVTLLNQTKAKGTDGIISVARSLAMDSYWKHGDRTMWGRRTDSIEAAAVQTLLDAGVLVPTVRTPPGTLPGEVRFFHDNVQSYLVAAALSAAPISQWGDHLFRAAGDPIFASVSGISHALPELYELFLWELAPKTRLRAVLAQQLDEWRVECARLFTINDILHGIHAIGDDKLRTKMDASAEPNVAPSVLLEKAIRCITEWSDDHAAAFALGHLHAVLARRLWTSVKAPSDAGEEMQSEALRDRVGAEPTQGA